MHKPHHGLHKVCKCEKSKTKLNYCKLNLQIRATLRPSQLTQSVGVCTPIYFEFFVICGVNQSEWIDSKRKEKYNSLRTKCHHIVYGIFRSRLEKMKSRNKISNKNKRNNEKCAFFSGDFKWILSHPSITLFAIKILKGRLFVVLFVSYIFFCSILFMCARWTHRNLLILISTIDETPIVHHFQTTEIR